MRKNVWLTVHGEQQYEGLAPDSLEQRLPGTLEETADGVRIRYEERNADGAVVTVTSLDMADGGGRGPHLILCNGLRDLAGHGGDRVGEMEIRRARRDARAALPHRPRRTKGELRAPYPRKDGRMKKELLRQLFFMRP